MPCVLSCRSWDEQNALLVESHERVIRDLTEEAEAKLASEVLGANMLRQEKDALAREAGEVRWSGALWCVLSSAVLQALRRPREPLLLCCVRLTTAAGQAPAGGGR
jgi:hypothetical protein